MCTADDRKYSEILIVDGGLRSVIDANSSIQSVQPMILHGDTSGAYPHSVYSVVSFQFVVRRATERISFLSQHSIFPVQPLLLSGIDPAS